MKTWTLQDAKARFSELVNRARKEGPQVVARRGEEAVVVLGGQDWHDLTRQGGEKDLVRFFQRSPLADLDPDLFARDRDGNAAAACAEI